MVWGEGIEQKMKRERDLEIISSLHLSQAHKHRNSVKQMFVELEATVPFKIKEVCELGWGGESDIFIFLNIK